MNPEDRGRQRHADDREADNSPLLMKNATLSEWERAREQVKQGTLGSILLPLEGESKYHGHQMFYKLTEEEVKLHDSKNSDYAGGGNPLGNFLRVAKVIRPFIRPEIADSKVPVIVALTYMLKQVDGVVWMLGNSREPKAESMEDKLRDISVYAKLAHILLVEGDKE